MHSDLKRELQEAVGAVYEIERELTRGGMSRVFVAVERSLGRRVVIKVLAPELLSGISAARFQREIQVTANLQHPHILPVLSVGISGSLHYYVTPYVAGESLRARIDDKGALAVEDAVHILQDVADALAFAHERGVIHRDVKPGNVLLSGGHAILADFGIAGAMQQAANGDRLTGTGHGIGTPGYMAPEQLAGDPTIDARADVFALGVLGYEMLCGNPPFGDPSLGGLALAYFTEPRALDELRPAVPSEVAQAISRAMARNPAERFATAAEFSDALRPVTSSYRAHKRSSRRVRFAVAALAILVLAGGTAALGRDRLALLRGSDDGVKMLAVLPFKNLGPPEDAYFADGVTEELTSRLASVTGLGVISRTSADQYRDSRKPLREIARELGANYVLEGSVRWERSSKGGRDRVRVTPQLIRVRDDNHLWTRIYDEELSGVFDVQTKIAEQVTGALSVALAGDELHHVGARPTESLEAWDAYMRGERLLAREGSNAASATRAIELLTEATTADPRFALAFAKLSLGHLMQYEHYYDRTGHRLLRARAAAESAFALNPTLPDAHLALGHVHESTGEFERASAEYAIAERGRPNDFDILAATASLSMRRGQWDEGLKRLARAAKLNPRSPEANFTAAEGLAITHDYAGAAAHAKRGLAADPNIVGGHVLVALIDLLHTGDRARARAATEAIMVRFGAEQTAASGGFDMLVGTLDTTHLATLARVPISGFGGNPIAYYYWRTLLFEFWRPAAARAAADSLIRAAQTLVAERPNDPGVHAAKGWLFAVKGLPDSAARSARQALELAPVTDDAFAWSGAAHQAAGTFVRIGDYDTAIDQLEQLLRAPSWISIPVLRTDPLWSRMRGHPRFERLLSGG
jgi:serine/threonine protein kinase/tetratricopeptide (TPR) repeat protein